MSSRRSEQWDVCVCVKVSVPPMMLCMLAAGGTNELLVNRTELMSRGQWKV